MFNFRTKTDAIEEAKKQAIEKQNEEMRNLQIACREIFNNQNGLYVLKFLKKICNWECESNTDANTLLYRGGRRDIWLILRTLLPKDVLAQVEIYDKDNK